MSKYKVGDKVVMEITDKVEVMEEPNYILSDATVVNQGYIDKAAEPLSTYIEQARAEGQNEAWELAKKIVLQPINGGYKRSEFEEIFGCGYISDIFEKYTYPEAATKVSQWEKAKEEIKVGDVVSHEEKYGVVISEGTICFRGFADDGTPFEWYKERCTKTGRHIDIDGFLKQIGEENDEK